MRLRFWGTRGSLPVAADAATVAGKIARALVAADGRRFDDERAALEFVTNELPFSTGGGYGGATSCVEIDRGTGPFLLCDLGSGLRGFGGSAIARYAEGRPRDFRIFLSHPHWDHIMGFPFFGPAYDPQARITIYAGHAEAREALIRQQEAISFPVPFAALGASIRFVTLKPEEPVLVDGLTISTIRQFHDHDSYGFRIEGDGRTLIYSTDSEHRIDDMEGETRFERFFRGADTVICDTMYSLADAVTLREDWGHSSSLTAIDLCRAAGARRLVMFHHEPAASDAMIETVHRETIRYEELGRGDRPPIEVVCAYDGLELDV